MTKLIILRGNSGSGKTTIAKELQKLFGKNTMLISQDVIRREMLNVDDGDYPLCFGFCGRCHDFCGNGGIDS